MIERHVPVDVIFATKEYTVLMVPKPEICFGKQSGGTICVDEAKNTDSLYIALPGFYWEGFGYQLNKFKCVIAPKEGAQIAITEENGNKITQAMKDAMNNLKKGDKIMFYDIFAQYPDPLTKKLSDNIRMPTSAEYIIE